MFGRMSTAFTVAIAWVGLFCSLAWADGFIVVHPWVPPEPIAPMPPKSTPLEVRTHRVDTQITDNVAITRIDQVFYNPISRQLEGTYIFPLADDVSIQKFSMFMDGKEVHGELLDRDKAAKIYQDIVNKNRDPALLEYAGTRMYRARVFPIPAMGEVRIQLEYSQTIEITGGLGTYRYPLNTEKFSAAPLRDVSVRVKITSQLPLATVFCPSHQASIDRNGKNEATVGYEGKDIKPDKDFIVGYQVSNEEFGLALMTYRESGQDGYFMARLSPAFASDKKPLPKDISFVIDTSGSMSGKKIEQAREALQFCLRNLRDDDRFNVIAFSTEVRPWRDQLVAVTEQSRGEAREYVSSLSAGGGTNINDALLTALKQESAVSREGSRPRMIVFLTDGLPTIGETNVSNIIRNVGQANASKTRLFVFGVGNDVNTLLLDKMAEDNHGTRQYVSEQENLEIKLSSFYTMIDSPVLSEITLTFGSPDAYDVYPRTAAELFKGSELIVFGRYKAQGLQPVVLKGRRGDAEVVVKWEKDFPDRQTRHDYLPRLWANRKIGYLLDEMRINGENAELKDEVVKLAKRYGILTPYTSFLVLEDAEARGVAVNKPASTSVNIIRQSGAAATAGEAKSNFSISTGGNAVDTSQSLLRMKGGVESESIQRQMGTYFAKPAIGGSSGAAGGRAPTAPLAANAPDAPVRYVGSKTFYRDGGRWIDSAYDELGQKTSTRPATNQLRLFSKEYYDLVAAHPEAGKYFALGTQVIVVLDDKVYETMDDSR